MNLTTEQQKEFAKFPPALRSLVEAELADGNAIVAIEHGFPAAPCGASIKLAHAVNEVRRKSRDGLSFYARNNSSHAGEFTTVERHFFVLEPPLPPPPDPDMDAIRKAHEPKQDALTRLANRAVGSSIKVALGELSSSPSSGSTFPENRERTEEAPQPQRRSLQSTETDTSLKRVLHFRDKRPPHEVQFALERELMTLFAGAMDNRKLCLLAKGSVNGARYFFELRFEAALLLTNCYSLRIESSWAEHAATHHDYHRKTSDSWFNLWTRDLMAANPPAEGEGSTRRYHKLAEAALKAEAHLDSVAAIQQAVVSEMKQGGSFGTSHKEGGSNIYWRNGRFIRSNYGDYPGQQEFTDEAEFLKMLRQFCHWEVARHAGSEKPSEFDAWKLILRRIRPK